ncbi:MAG: alpha/beta hydrolase [Chloroflexota bacterium]
MTTELEVRTSDGRTLIAHDTAAPTGPSAHALVWHHGSPHTGRPIAPLLAAAADSGIRLVTYARPAYGGSTPQPGRRVADAAADVAAIVEALGIHRFAVMGASGGGPHALACAALLPDRVTAAVTFASPAPYDGNDAWFAGMAAPGALRAALEGRAARARFAETDTFDPGVFTAADWAALQGAWGALGQDAGAADAFGPDGLIDDDVAFATPWGADLAAIGVPALVVQGVDDRMIPASHGLALAAAIPGAESWLRPGDGHVSVLAALPDALRWLTAHASR